MSIQNPLFDPRSTYNRLRNCIDPAEKLQGYFHWLSELKELAQKEAAAGKNIVVPATTEPRPTRAVEYKLAADAPTEPSVFVLAYRADAPGGIEVLKTPAQASMFDVGERTLRVDVYQVPADRRLCGCRAYVLEPAVLRRLAAAAGFLDPDELMLRAVFSRDAVGDNERVIRLLTTVPEIEGRVQASGEIHLEAPLPTDQPLVTTDDFQVRACWIVVVLDDRPPVGD